MVLLCDLDDDVLSYILSYMSVPSLVRLRNCCRMTDVLVNCELEHRYYCVLSPFVENVLHFREELDFSGSIICGDTALMFALGIPSSESNMDISTSKSNLFHILAYLVRIEGYTIASLNTSSILFPLRPREKRTTVLARGSMTITLVQSCSDSASFPIIYMPSTSLFTFLHGSHISIAYPVLLEQFRALLNTLHYDATGDVDALEPFLRSQQLLGFDYHSHSIVWARENDPTASCPPSGLPSCPHTVRWVDDAFHLRTSFATIERRMAIRFSFDKLTVIWWRGGSPCHLSSPCGSAFTLPHASTILRSFVTS
ncbi:hypothetical protein FKP32DRAFT_1567008 [Trametes sanguinea]|nr:hypothetical protein FKP32DRAFT_1567008 [Trametes sanguinea]